MNIWALLGLCWPISGTWCIEVDELSEVMVRCRNRETRAGEGTYRPREGLSEPAWGPEWGAVSWLAGADWPGLTPSGPGLRGCENESEAFAGRPEDMDGMTIREDVIKVAISNPPQRKVPEKPEARRACGECPATAAGLRGVGVSCALVRPRGTTVTLFPSRAVS